MKKEILTRQELHELVWSEPISTIVKRYNISDVGLRKVCIRKDIPIPVRGYWTKIRFGYKVSYFNRRKYAYLGSSMHFFRALWNNSLKQNGFTLGIHMLGIPNTNVIYDDIIVLDNNHNKYLINKKLLTIYYGSMYSRMYFLKSKVLIGENGSYDQTGILWYEDMAKPRIADMLPYEYTLEK